MDDTQNSAFRDLITHIVGGPARSLAERKGETKERPSARAAAIVRTIMCLLPRDAAEALLASHCVMFHELMADSAHDLLRGEVEAVRKATRSSIVAMDRCFRANLSQLERYQMRNAEGRRDDPAVQAPARTASDRSEERRVGKE